MSAKREFLLQLYNSGAIDDDGLQKGIRMLETEEEKKYKQQQKDVVNELKKVLSQRSSELKLVDKPKCGYFKAYEMFVSKYKDPNKLFNDKKSIITKQIAEELEELGVLKFQLALIIQFYKDDSADMKIVTGVLYGDQMAILSPDKIDEFYNSSSAKIQTGIEKFTNTASGLEISHCIRIYLNIAKYKPFKGSSPEISLPKVLLDKKAILNLPNKDGICILWSVLAALFYNKNNPTRLSSYRKYLDVIKLEGIDFPTPISQIPKIEKQNPWFAINVYGCSISKKQNLTVFPYYISDRPPEIRRVNLLLLEVEVPEDTTEGTIDEDYNPEEYKYEQPEKETMYH